MKRDLHMWSDTEIYMKRDIYMWQETYIYEKRPTYVTWHLYVYVSRDLYIWKDTYTYEKRPTYVTWHSYKYKKRPRHLYMNICEYVSCIFRGFFPYIYTHMNICEYIWIYIIYIVIYMIRDPASASAMMLQERHLYIWKETYTYEKRPIYVKRDPTAESPMMRVSLFEHQLWVSLSRSLFSQV